MAGLVIGYEQIVAAAKDVHDDPRDFAETVAMLGIDPDAAGHVLYQMASGALRRYRSERDVGVSTGNDPDEVAFTTCALMGFIVGVAVGREAHASEGEL